MAQHVTTVLDRRDGQLGHAACLTDARHLDPARVDESNQHLLIRKALRLNAIESNDRERSE